MKRQSLSFGLLFVLLLGIATCLTSYAARPNPPAIAGTVPAVILGTEPGGTNLVVVPPKILVLDERGRTVADVETTVVGQTGTFNIPLKKAGTYVVVGYYAPPNAIRTFTQVVDVPRKQTATVSLVWQP